MTVPHYGKREPGGLTASNPGDTLHFVWASYNDSGDSEAATGFAVTDIEVFKNGIAATRATDSGYSLISDTGQIGDRVGLYRCSVQLFNTADDTGHYESGAWYQVAVDSVTIDGRTVRMWVGSFEIGRQRVDVREVVGDTGAAGWVKNTFAQGFTDTGINQRLAQIQSDVDTGLRVHIDDSDTGLKDTIADLDTGLRGILNTTGVNVSKLVGDTGAANWLKTVYTSGFTDTGLYSRLDKLSEDTGGVNINSIQGDTGAAGWLRATFAAGFADTGLNQRLAQIQSDVDTGLRVHIDDSDTGVKDAIADLDTGLRDHIDNTDTGLRRFLDNLDTGVKNRFDRLAEDTGGVNINSIQGDTGAAGWLRAAFANGFADTGLYSRIDKLAEDTGGVNINAIAGDTGAAGWLKAAFADGFADTGINDRLAKILADTDTGIQGGVNVTQIIGDTGVADRLLKFAGSKLSDAGMVDTGTLAGTRAGTIDANVTYVNETQVQGTGANGNEWRPA